MRWARAVLPDGSTRYGRIDGQMFVPSAGTPFDDLGAFEQRSGEPVDAAHVRLLSPSDPATVLVMWRAFRKTAAERVDHPPYLAVKGVGAGGATTDGAEIVIPPLLVEFPAIEAELAVVIGRTAGRVSPEQAWEVISGFTVMNDVTAMELVHRTGSWPDELPRLVSGTVMSKSFDTFCSFGPTVDTDLSDERIRDGLSIIARVNGEERHRGSTADYKFSVGEVVSRASQLMTLRPGDVISLGTPAPVVVQAGDLVECEVEGVGVLRNVVVHPRL